MLISAAGRRQYRRCPDQRAKPRPNREYDSRPNRRCRWQSIARSTWRSAITRSNRQHWRFRSSRCASADHHRSTEEQVCEGIKPIQRLAILFLSFAVGRISLHCSGRKKVLISSWRQSNGSAPSGTEPFRKLQFYSAIRQRRLCVPKHGPQPPRNDYGCKIL